MENDLIKLKLMDFCKNSVMLKIDSLHDALRSLEEALMSETKSSAGDKHETGRAMIQLEREQLGRQLAELEEQSQILSRIDSGQTHNLISVGSLVKTSAENYFISVGLGKLEIDKKIYYAISIQSPIGRILKGKREGDVLKFRDKDFKIEGVS